MSTPKIEGVIDRGCDPLPGEHVLVLSSSPVDSLGLRRRGFQLRDAFLVALPGVRATIAMLFRVPTEGTTIDGLLRLGTGALYVGGCRVQGASDQPGEGRWPSNFVLVHTDECRDTGPRRVRSSSLAKGVTRVAIRRSGVHAQAGGHQTVGRPQTVKGHGDGDGMETIAGWECAAGCPARALDALSGVLSSGKLDQSKVVAENKIYGKRPKNRQGMYEPDSGGASRFYPQLTDVTGVREWFDRLLYGSG